MLRGADKGKDKEKEGDEAKKDEAKPTGFSKTAEEWKRQVSVFASLKQAEKASDKGASCLRMFLGNFESYQCSSCACRFRRP